MKSHLPWLLILVAALIAAATTVWPALRFGGITAGDLTSRFSALFLFALLIERTVEVILTIWRAEDSNKRQAAVQRLIAAGTIATDPALESAQEAVIEYKAETQRWALPISFFLGLVISALGVRAIEQFLDPTTLAKATEYQLRSFHFADVVLTAGLLAGGADPIHKVLDAFNQFMQTSSAKAAGTMPT
jgi:hypothetical protein